jgi:hypothetical protein
MASGLHQRGATSSESKYAFGGSGFQPRFYPGKTPLPPKVIQTSLHNRSAPSLNIRISDNHNKLKLNHILAI